MALLDFLFNNQGGGLFGGLQARQPTLDELAYGQLQQQPQQQAPAGPDFGTRLSAGFQGFAGGGGLLPALARAGQGFSTGVTPENQTVKALVASGIEPGLAQTIAQDRNLLRAVLPNILGTAGKTSDIHEYEYAKKQGFTGSLSDWMARKRAGAGEYGLQPIWGTGPDGKPAILQLGKSGEAIASKLPEGIQVGKDVIKIDAGTHTILLDPVTRQTIGQIPKNIEQKEAAEERGKAVGQAQVNLPNVLATSQQTLDLIEQIEKDPYRQRGTGGSAIFNVIPATGGYDFAQKVAQLKGKTFLEAYQSLKGGGAITEIEGQKAENAIARLNTMQTEEAFLQALGELKSVIKAGMERAKQKAGGIQSGSTPAAPVNVPSAGTGWTDIGNGVKIRKKE